jgi:hypothetical protein
LDEPSSGSPQETNKRVQLNQLATFARPPCSIELGIQLRGDIKSTADGALAAELGEDLSGVCEVIRRYQSPGSRPSLFSLDI